MDVLKIPFVEKVGINRSCEGILELDFTDAVQNHVSTFHAGAQFALAETASAEMLQRLFPELSGKTAPLLRDSQIKFRKPAQQTLSAYSSVSDDAIEKFREQYERKGRSSITIIVELRNADGLVTATGSFNWFIQRLDDLA